MGQIHPRQHWDGLYSPPPGNFCTDPRLKSRFRPRIGPGCGCRGAGPWVGRVLGARRDVDRWLPRRAGARAALGRLALIPFRKLLHRSPVKVAVPATNRAGLRLPGGLGRGWGIGALVDEFKRTARRDMHGREARVCARVAPSAGRPCRRKWRPLLPLHSKVGQQGAPAEPRRLPHPPGTGLAAPVGLRRLAHRALVAQP